MPIVHECKQGSEQWVRLRMGKPTASAFDRIITPTGKPSTQADKYIRDLLAELMMGRPLEGPKMPWMDRGSALEAEAAMFYELQRDVELKTVGFITNDAGTIGASPDRLVGEDGLVEIKAPLAHTHIGYLLFSEVDKEYRVQLQGQLHVSARTYCDICSYHPELPPAIVRVERDEEFIEKLAAELDRFVARLEAAKADIRARGWILEKREPEMPFGISADDVEALIAASFPKAVPA